MAWIWLVFAGLFEVAGVTGINRWNKDRGAASLTLMLGGFAMSFVLLTLAMKDLSMGTAYAIWTAIGTVGGTIVGMLAYGESKQPKRLLFLALVVGAAVGLKLVG